MRLRLLVLAPGQSRAMPITHQELVDAITDAGLVHGEYAVVGSAAGLMDRPTEPVQAVVARLVVTPKAYGRLQTNGWSAATKGWLRNGFLMVGTEPPADYGLPAARLIADSRSDGHLRYARPPQPGLRGTTTPLRSSLHYDSSLAFLGAALVRPSEAFRRAHGQSVAGLALAIAAVDAVIGAFARDFNLVGAIGAIVAVPLVTLLCWNIIAGIARRICSSSEDTGALATQVMALTTTFSIPVALLGLLDMPNLQGVLSIVVLVVSAVYVTIAFREAFDTGTGTAFAGLLVGYVVLIVVLVIVIIVLAVLLGGVLSANS